MQNLGEPSVVSIAIDTPDVGPIIGLGIVFENSTFADEFFAQMYNYFDTPSGQYRDLSVHFHDGTTYCDLAIDVASSIGTMSISVDHADHKVLEDVLRGLEARPYFFLIACLLDETGGIQPYKADENFIAKGTVYVDGHGIHGNADGGWTKITNLFS